jgi:hypothetical protein
LCYARLTAYSTRRYDSHTHSADSAALRKPGTSLAFDCIIIALPLPVLITLRLQRRQKAALVAVFALGFFVTIIQIIRIFTIKDLKTYTDSQPIVLWSVIEISLGVGLPIP